MIAIIGILASVVLASLNSARSKGADAAVKSNLNNARAQAELYYDSNANSYGTGGYPSTGSGMCISGANTIFTMVSAADTANGGGAADCDSNNTAWAAEAALVASTTSYYCVDSTGKSVTTGASKGAGAFACP